jgi:GTP 3',8-cyclase
LRKESKKSITIGAGFLIHKENYKKLPGLARRLKEIGIDYLQIRPIVMPQDDSLTRNWAKGHKYIQKTMGFSDNKFYVFPIDYRYRQMITKQRSYQHCHIHNLLGIVGADGNVYLCSLFRGDSRFSFGNLYSQPFGRIWMGAKSVRPAVITGIMKFWIIC